MVLGPPSVAQTWHLRAAILFSRSNQFLLTAVHIRGDTALTDLVAELQFHAEVICPYMVL